MGARIGAKMCGCDACEQVFDWDDPNEEDDQADVQELQVEGGSTLSKAELDAAAAMSMSSVGGLR